MGAERLPDQIKELLLRFYDAETSLDPEGHWRRFDDALDLLEKHTHDGSLKPQDRQAVTKFLLTGSADFSWRAADDKGLTARRRERLSLALMANHAREGQIERAAWHLALLGSQERHVHNPDQTLDAATVEVRSGSIGAATQRLGRFLQDPGGPEALQTRARVLLAEASLVSGTLPRPAAASGSPDREAWLALIARCLLSREPERLTAACRRNGEFYDPLCEVEAYFLVLALDRFDLCDRLSTPQNVHRRADEKVRQAPSFARLVDFAKELHPFIEAKDSAALTLGQVNALGSVNEGAALLSSLFHEMIALMATSRVLKRVRLTDAAILVQRRYQRLCWTASDGTLVDTLCLATEPTSATPASLPVAGNYQNVIASTLPRQASLLGSSVKIASVVLAAKLRHMVRTDRQTRSTRDEVLTACAEILAKDLTKFRGGLQKLVQLGAGLEAVFPDSVRAALSQASTTGFPIPPAEVRTIVERELGRPVAEIFRGFSDRPLASGSISQVHQATGPRNESFAVKVRIPKVESMIAGDFKGIARLNWFLSSVLPISHEALNEVVKYCADLAREECSFDLERKHMQRALALFPEDSGIRIPKVADDLQGNGVLVSDLAGGVDFSEFLSNSTEDMRRSAGINLVRLTLRCLRHGFLKYDLDPSNFKFDGSRLWVLDFGGVVPYEWSSPQNFLQLIVSLQQGRTDLLRERLLGLTAKPETYDFDKDLLSYRNLLLKPFLTDAPFRFTTEYARQVFFGMTVDHPNQGSVLLKTWWMPQCRIYWTLYSMLGRLEAEANWFELAAEESLRPSSNVAADRQEPRALRQGVEAEKLSKKP